MFGSKRVLVKQEKGKIAIRVGGGYMSIDEFLAIYTPIELDKLESLQSDQRPTRDRFVQKLLESFQDTKPKYKSYTGLMRKRLSPSPVFKNKKGDFAKSN